MAAVSGSPTTLYSIDRSIVRRRLAIVIGSLAIVPIVAVTSGEQIDVRLAAVYGVVCLLTVALFLWFIRRQRLTLSPAGVEFRNLDYTIFSPWSNVERIETRAAYTEGKVEGFVLRLDHLKTGGTIKWGRFTNPRGYSTKDDYEHFIPISIIVTKQWRSAPFGQDVRRYAPRLLEQL